MHLDDVLTELVEHSGDRLLRVAYQLTHDAAAAQDLAQEALLRVYQSVRIRGLAPEDWYAYLRRAVINEYVRTRRLRRTTSAGRWPDMTTRRRVRLICSALVSALNRLPTRPSTHGCSGPPGPSGAFEIFFSYPEGPPVLVSILIGCHPAIGNGDLHVTSASSVMPVVRQLLNPR